MTTGVRIGLAVAATVLAQATLLLGAFDVGSGVKNGWRKRPATSAIIAVLFACLAALSVFEYGVFLLWKWAWEP